MNASPALEPGQPVGEALRSVASEILARAQLILDDPAREPTVTVHDIRRAMKRWRAFLRMLAPILGDGTESLREQARDLSRKLTAARDAQSAIDAFQDAVEAGLEQSAALSAQSLRTIQSRLEALRAEGERSIWNDERRREMSEYLANAATQVAGWNFQTIAFDDVADTLSTTYRRARRAIPRSWDEITAEELHELRRRVVEHRYQMELIEPAWPRLGRLWVDEAQRLRTRLGKYQDLAVLTLKAGPKQPLARWRSKLMPLIAHRQHEHAGAAKRIAARLFAESPKAFRRRLESLWEAQSDDGSD
ncbi:MAG TPA: CHAD domain-containing protein [Burkholderiales bacterium]|jgi:CHAD domain-containing protein|nr:CHAD domain-containing protein [Burkholderiales bacterium]